MAVMTHSTRIVYWDLFYGDNNTPIGDILKDHIEQIRIVHKLPNGEKPKKYHGEEKAPSEAYITVTSNNYFEDWIAKGMIVEIRMGYSPVDMTTVFRGKITRQPEGSAQDMLNYTFIAKTPLITWALTKRTRVFKGSRPKEIIEEIATHPDNRFSPIIDLDKKHSLKMKPDFKPMQKDKTDLEMLDELARRWNCVYWLKNFDTLVFVDVKKAYEYGVSTVASTGRAFPGTYTLGYRTDAVPCNVQQIAWKYHPSKSRAQDGGIQGFGETGSVTDVNDYRVTEDISSPGKTINHKIQQIYLEVAQGKRSGAFIKDSIQWMVQAENSGKGVEALRKFYMPETYGESGAKLPPPETGNTGFEVEITLNEGDPRLIPPFQATLYSGVNNPRADNSHLPNWLLQTNGLNQVGTLKLNVYETELTFEHGMLKSTLKSSIGMDM